MSANLRAACFMLLGMSAFTCNDAVIKHLSGGWSIGQLMLLRGMLVVGAFALALRLARQPLLSRDMLQRWSLARAACELGATFCFLSGIALLPLATATTLIFGAPLMLTVLAALLLQERVPLVRWLAVLVGFAGVVLVMQPGADDADPALLLPLAAAAFTALRDIAVRRVPAGLTSLQISLLTATVVTAGGLALTPVQGWRAVDAATGAWIVLSAALLCAAYFLYVVATRTGELSFVAPIKYVSIVLAIAIGYWVWGETPGAVMVLGAGVIALSGIYMIYAEQRALRRLRLTAARRARAGPIARPAADPPADQSGR